MDSHQQIIDGINAELSDYNTELEKVEAALEDAAAAQRATKCGVTRGVDTLGKLFSKLEMVKVKAIQASKSMGEFFSELENIEVSAERIQEATNGMAQSIAQAFESAARSAKSFAEFLRAVTVDIVSSYLRQAAAKQLAQGNIAAAVGLGLASGFTQRIGVPALADGGVAFGPTMALIGDNKNASIDPEVVAPLSKLRDMMGGNKVEVYGRISGNDIFLSNSRAGTIINRYA